MDRKCYHIANWLFVAICLFHTAIGLIKFFMPSVIYGTVETAVVVSFAIFASFCIAKNRDNLSLVKQNVKSLYGGVDMIMMYILMLWLILSCIFMTIQTKSDYLLNNEMEINDSLITFLCIYPLGKLIGGRTEYIKKETFLKLLHGLFITWTAVMLFILLHVFSGQLIILFDKYTIGMVDGVNFEISCNRNVTASIAITSLLISIYMLYRYSYKQLIWHVYLISAVIHYVTLVLTQSRTSILAGTIGFAAIVGVTAFVKYELRGKKTILSCLLGILGGGVFFGLRFPVYRLYLSVYSLVTGSESFLIPREIIDSSTATMSGRIPIWSYCIKEMMNARPLLTGVSPLGVFQRVEDAMNIHYMPLNAHNEFLEIGVGLGIPALIAFIVFVVLIVIRSYNVYFVKKASLHYLILPLIIMTMMIISLAESFLGFYQNYIQFIFYFLCGYVYCLGDKKIELRDKVTY